MYQLPESGLHWTHRGFGGQRRRYIPTRWNYCGNSQQWGFRTKQYYPVGVGGGSEGVTCFKLGITLTFILSCFRDLVPLGVNVPNVGLNLTGLTILATLCALSTGSTFYVSVVEVILINMAFNKVSTVVCDLTNNLLSFTIVTTSGGLLHLSPINISILNTTTRGVNRLITTNVVVHGLNTLCCLPILLMDNSMANTTINVINKVLVGHLNGAGSTGSSWVVVGCGNFIPSMGGTTFITSGTYIVNEIRVKRNDST